MPEGPVNRSSRGFDHETMDVYGVALDFVEVAHEIIVALPRGKSALADQLERAAVSIALNVAEGSGEFSRKEKARFYRMALRSAAECAAILDVARRTQAVSSTHTIDGKQLLNRIGAMLNALIHRLRAQ